MGIERFISGDNISVRESMDLIDKNTQGVLFIVDERKRLIGVVTDGDIRRWILKNGLLEEGVGKIMNKQPIFLFDAERGQAVQAMKKHSIKALPILEKNGCIQEILFFEDYFFGEKRRSKIELPVVIMAGGQGTRLYPYTKILPKPLIPIGEIPIVERIIDKFYAAGCKDFYLTINYKKNMIRSYFSELERDYRIHYVDEDRPLGTGGSLYLLKDSLKGTFFLSNCDVLIEADYESIYRYHRSSGNQITIVTSLKNHRLPYGVVVLDEDSKVIEFKEKPEHHYLVNTGMYILESDLIEWIPKETFYHMTQLIQRCIQQGISVGTYPISEGSWLDMGEFKEMDIMFEKLGIKN